MNASPSDLLFADYLAALRLHVEQDGPATLMAAQHLGRTALNDGIETLKFANMHDQALSALLAEEPSLVGKNRLTRKAAAFFGEAIMPIEGNHLAARAYSADLEQLNWNLNQRTNDLVASNHELQVQVDQRKSAEAALEASERTSRLLLEDSQQLERHLKQLTQQSLTATEHERSAMSLSLNDEIAQTLLGINIRMITLKTEIAAHHVNHNHQIAIIQQLVEDSAEMTKRLANEFTANPT